MRVVWSTFTFTAFTVIGVYPTADALDGVRPGRDIQDVVLTFDVRTRPERHADNDDVDPDERFTGLCIGDLPRDLPCRSAICQPLSRTAQR